MTEVTDEMVDAAAEIVHAERTRSHKVSSEHLARTALQAALPLYRDAEATQWEQDVERLCQERDEALAREAALREAINQLLDCIPLNGLHGGPLVGLKPHYEDGSDWRFVNYSYVNRLREVLATPSASLEAHNKRIAEQARREALEEAAKVVEDAGWHQSTPDPAWHLVDGQIEFSAAAVRSLMTEGE